MEIQYIARRHSYTPPFVRDTKFTAASRVEAQEYVAYMNEIVLADSEDWVELL